MKPTWAFLPLPIYLGKTAIFVGNVARAWKLAEKEYESNPTIAIGLQCRYSLITSSLNTIAGNITRVRNISRSGTLTPRALVPINVVPVN